MDREFFGFVHHPCKDDHPGLVLPAIGYDLDMAKRVLALLDTLCLTCQHLVAPDSLFLCYVENRPRYQGWEKDPITGRVIGPLVSCPRCSKKTLLLSSIGGGGRETWMCKAEGCGYQELVLAAGN